MGMSVTISAATAQDVEQIFRLQYLCFQSEAELYGNYRIDPLVQSLDSVRDEVATDLVFVARLGDEVVGSVRGFTDTDGTGRIGKLCVHPGSVTTASVRASCGRRSPAWRTGVRRPASDCTRGSAARKSAPLPQGGVRQGGQHHRWRRSPAGPPGEGRHRA